MNSFEFVTAKKIIWEIGTVKNIAEHCAALTIKRPMLVTDSGVIAAGIVDQVLLPLQAAGIEPLLFGDIQPDPPEAVVLAAVKLAKEHNIDGVIGLGGGSSMDVAKLIAVLAGSEQPLQAIYGVDNIRGGRLPLVLIPTTAGTGSEVTTVSIVTTGAATKSGVVSATLLPDLALLDAELTQGLPAAVTAATGIDAMVHAIEAFTSRHKKNIYSDMLAIKALNLLSQNIESAVHHGSNLEARANMLLGAMMAGQAFANAPVAAVHALAYPLGGNYHIPHGLSNSLVLPHVLRFNAPAAAGLYAELLPCVGNSEQATSVEQGAARFIQVMDELITKVELPKSLRAMNIPEQELPKLADEAMAQQRLLVNNPKEVTRDDALAIYKAAY
ncbi:iron-containing alcohol dehydrogenase [Halioxenophilus sp. WMMB6]|uniref:iron-containing alcohol dehydrogenase n=1 Tax=Halioxenophilus sp. WMMB6 TaxID=3073815 RepID=UPI00398BEFC1